MKAPAGSAGTRAPLDLDGLHQSIVELGLRGATVDDQLQAFCNRVLEAGFPLRRVSLSIGTLHPRYGAHSFVWRSTDRAVEHIARVRSSELLTTFLRSPLHYMQRTGIHRLRRRLDTGEPAEFPVFDDLRAEGMTDYAARAVLFAPADAGREDSGAPTHMLGPRREESLEGIFFSCATDLPEGFDDQQLRQIDAAVTPLALAVKSRATFDVASSLLATYIGEDAGRRVLTGEIDRGSLEVIPAVIWLCDLRGFTRMADRLPRDELVPLLDAYLEVMAEPVERHGGQILKFLGDGFLATFAVKAIGEPAVCSNDALGAAAELMETFPEFNARRNAAGLAVMDFGIALHQGEVLYGNIGTLDRLDFTVVGPAVNEASRIGALCRPLGRTVLISEAFHRSAGACSSRLISVGMHALRGVREPQELFTLGG